MSDFVDHRVKLERDDARLIQAMAHARDVDKAEILREIVANFCRVRRHEARILANLERDEGVSGSRRGGSGK